MPAEGTCPACGHIVIGDSVWAEDETLRDAASDSSSASPLPTAANKKTEMPPGYAPQRTLKIGDGMAQSRDYAALLLGIFIYDLLLIPSLYVWFQFFVLRTGRDLVIVIALAYMPVAWAITRLMCRVDAESGRWIIRNELLRRIFTRLNALWV